MEPLPPLPPLPALPPLPPLPPLPALAAPFEPDPLPALPPLKLTPWYDLKVSPVHAGNYDLGSCVHDSDIAELPFRQLWDGREWADKLPANATHWRGVDKGRWVNYLDLNPKTTGWYRMRFPKGEKAAPSYYIAEGDSNRLVGQKNGWYWMDGAGEMKPYACHPRWAAEWWHDGAPE